MSAVTLSSLLCLECLAKVGVVVDAIVVIGRNKVAHCRTHATGPTRPFVVGKVGIWLDIDSRAPAAARVSRRRRLGFRRHFVFVRGRVRRVGLLVSAATHEFVLCKIL